ncbi:MAG: hypothetical protein ACTHU0_00575 [Kofleriaceae bacterium]
MKRHATALASILALSALHGLAAAETADPYFQPLTMDRLTPESTLELDLGYLVFDTPDNIDVTAMGMALGGHYVAGNGFGGYAALPASYLSVDVDLGPLGGGAESELAIGNFELGGMYAKQLSRGAAVVVHAGLALPTADDDGVGAGQAIASVPRYGDLVQRVPNSTWLRLGVSPTGRSGKLFWRADLGIDLALDEDDTDLSPIVRLNVGGGLDLGAVHVLAEVVTNVISNADDEVTSTLAIGARFVSGNLRPGIALLLPLGFDNDYDPELALAASLAVKL